MKIEYYIVDDLGYHHRVAGIMEAAGAFACVQDLVSQAAITERFRDRPFTSLMISARPAREEMGFDQRLKPMVKEDAA